jgi:putative spermidine/putrescine transport system permease protein
MMRRLLPAFLIALIAFMVLPLVVFAPLSGMSLRAYAELFTSSAWLHAILNSLLAAAGTSVVVSVLGTLVALWLRLRRLRARGVLLAIVSAPIVMPCVLACVAIHSAFVAAGFANSLIMVALVDALITLPFAVFAVLCSARTLDPVLLRAAASLGAPLTARWRRVLLPLVGPGVAGGALVAFAVGFDDMLVALLAGLRNGLSPAISAAAVALAALALLVAGIAARRSRWVET